MAVKTLTARTVKTLKPSAAVYHVWDPALPGFGLRVSARGKKTWWIRYRPQGSRAHRWLKLGDAKSLRLAAARKLARDRQGEISQGRDPAAQRDEQRAALTVKQLAARFIDEYAKPRKRTWKDDQSKLACEVLPAWRNRPVTAITRQDCSALVKAIADRGAPIYANRVAALLSRLFRFAADEHLIPANIAAQLPKPGKEAGQRDEAEREDKPYTPDEIRAIWTATDSLGLAAQALYRLGLVTGQRPGEISGMAWAEIDGPWWTIPAARTKNRKSHRVFLTATALELLAHVPRAEVKAKQPRRPTRAHAKPTVERGADAGAPTAAPAVRVFAGFRGKRQIGELNDRVFADVRRRSKPRHAMRDTVATGMAAAGVSVTDVSHVLNHAVGLKVTAGYNAYAYDREKRRALLIWERKLQAIVEAKPEGAKVVAFG